MGTQSIVHGRITLSDNFIEAKTYISSLHQDDTFPFFRSDMFSLGAYEPPFFYEDQVITFGATYKAIEFYWTSFIIKFENILSNLNFKTAKIQLETAFYGTYNFTWIKKNGTNNFTEEDRLIEMNEWYFGYGFRSCWGGLEKDFIEKDIFSIDFEYPIKFDERLVKEFNAFIEKVKDKAINSKIYLDDYIKYPVNNNEKVYPILIYLKTKKFIDFNAENGKGYVITKLKDIEQI